MTFVLTVKKREQKRGKPECSLPLSPCMLLMLKSGRFGFHGFVYVCVLGDCLNLHGSLPGEKE